MAYNSDGYIMIDFSMVDFRKTNQTIDGLFERCKNVIGTNKFVIVINANNKTPLPSTVSITNGQYVIESVLYTFSISSVDNLHITKKTTPEELIDDDHITLKTTWSSSKIDDELDEKQDKLTPVSPIAINENNQISFDIKTFSYRGDGELTREIELPINPKLVLFIYGKTPSTSVKSSSFDSFCNFGVCFTMTSSNYSITTGTFAVSIEDNKITMTSNTPVKAFNVLGLDYIVYYI